MSGDLFTYERFEPGTLIGHQDVEIDQVLIDQWNQVYGPRPNGQIVPLGVVSVIIMRVHSAIVSPRPPGNVHVGQHFILHAPIRVGQKLRASVSCREKRISGTRKIVAFSVNVEDAGSGAPLFEGLNTIFWAA